MDLHGMQAGCVRFRDRGTGQEAACWGRLGAAGCPRAGSHTQPGYQRRGREFSFCRKRVCGTSVSSWQETLGEDVSGAER